MRYPVTLALDGRAPLRRPAIPVRRLTLRPQPHMPPLAALVSTPPEPLGVLIYFPGFGTPLGEWELAKCQFLAEATSLTVVITEIPGMSRFRGPIPAGIRRDMLRRRPESWAELTLSYFSAAMDAGGVTNTDVMQVLGYSTGCSLAAAALPLLANWGPIEGLSLVEPVAITKRSIASLNAHNLADWGRLPWVHATNQHHDWVVHAHRRQALEPGVHYSPVDLLAIAQVLASEELLNTLGRVELERCAIARGERSSLCRRPDFERLDAMLAERAIPGPTITVPRLGHQLWHSFPTLAGLVTAMLAESNA